MKFNSEYIPLEDIAALLGHGLGRIVMTARYAYADLERLHETDKETGTKTDTRTVVEFQAASTA